jgi:hypothetical protein
MADSNNPATPNVAEATSPITAELADHIEAQRKEYGQWVAKEQIFAPNGALAYNPGDAVPADNAKRLGYIDAGQVVKNGSKEHKELLVELGRA